ncbi:DNA damage-inducible protein 1 [Cladophialophora carrionii]|uniref:DNA damage-inducible protein 1 n=1 Tax=Cladophialophora carrionii TaxID=86049 RepID=A0A1C1CQS5_9EURO|nr:DNA damage-inducible protein 1 [Cladophialophora carrionii]
MTLNDLKTFVQAETNVPPVAQIFLKDGRPVIDTSVTLAQFGVSEGDLIAMAISTNPPRRRPADGTSGGESPAQRARNSSGQEQLRLRILEDRAVRAEVERQDPELAAAAQDSQRFHDLWDSRRRQNERMQAEKEANLARLEADPFNLEAQQKIEEMIREERVAENMQKAMEEFPEAFGRVTMLYIDVVVNGNPIKAFVDSGAQTTIMSPSAAERCGILRLVDKRFSGMAKGVGTAQILGRVHSADIQIGQYNLASSFTVMEGKDVDLLLGLDMLKRHQMCIDLKKNCLRIESDEIPFLPESEIPKMMEEVLENEPKVEGPGGSTIGTKTGTVMPGASASSSGAQVQATSNATTQSSASTTAGASPAPSAPGPGNFGQPQPITAESIARVTELGFSREEAIAALRQADGNVELAISLLL